MDQRSWRVSLEWPGLRDEGQPEPAYVGLPCGISSSASSATANSVQFQETAQAETYGTSAARSVAQLPTLTRRLQMDVSCSIWGRCTEVRCCLKTTAALSDRCVVAGATSAGATLFSGSFALGTPSRTDDSPGHQAQRPAVWQPGSNFFRARSQCLQENLWTTSSCSPSFARPGRWHSRDAWSLAAPRLGQRVSKEPREDAGPGLCSVAYDVACSLLKSRKVSTRTPS